MSVIVDSYPFANVDTNFYLRSSQSKISQSFTGDGGTLHSVKLYITKGGSPTGNATVKIYAHTGTFGTSSLPTGSALATSDNFDVSTASPGGTIVTFNFTGGERITLTNGTKYVVSIEYDGGDESNYLLVGADASSPTHAGNLGYYSDTWYSSSIYDTIFYLYKVSPWLSGWDYRKGMVIQGVGGAGTNYQIPLLIGESSGASGEDFDVESHSADFPDAKNDGGDLRFTDNDGETTLDFWVESVSGTTPNRLALVWVEVADDLGSALNIYCYYGKSGASNGSNGADTFLFFDDFDGESLDTDKWTHFGGGDLSFSSGILSVSNIGATDPSKLIADENTGGQTGNHVALRALFRITGGTNIDARNGLSIKTNLSDGYGYNYLCHDHTNLDEIVFLDDWVAWGDVEENSWTKNTWYTFEILDTGTVIKARRDDGAWKIQLWSGRSGYPALTLGSYDETTDWDWALVRKSIPTEPSYSSVYSEESAPPAVGIASMRQLIGVGQGTR